MAALDLLGNLSIFVWRQTHKAVLLIFEAVLHERLLGNGKDFQRFCGTLIDDPQLQNGLQIDYLGRNTNYETPIFVVRKDEDHFKRMIRFDNSLQTLHIVSSVELSAPIKQIQMIASQDKQTLLFSIESRKFYHAIFKHHSSIFVNKFAQHLGGHQRFVPTLSIVYLFISEYSILSHF